MQVKIFDQGLRGSYLRLRFVRGSSEHRLRKIARRAECGRIPFNQNTRSFLKFKVESGKYTTYNGKRITYKHLNP